jgi:hypothetical protein
VSTPAPDHEWSKAMETLHRVREQQLLVAYKGLNKAIGSHYRERLRQLRSKEISPQANDQWYDIVNWLACALGIAQHHLAQNFDRIVLQEISPPSYPATLEFYGAAIDDLIGVGDGDRLRVALKPMDRLSERYLEHRAKANERNRRYRERKALPAPQRAAELANGLPATPGRGGGLA